MMTILKYLQDYNLIDENNELTEEANDLGYNNIETLTNDVYNTFLINFKTKTIIPAYKFSIYPIGVSGEIDSDIIQFRVYNDLTITNNIDLTEEEYVPEIIWKNNSSENSGVFQAIKNVDGKIITFSWSMALEVLNFAGTLKFSVRFVKYGLDAINNNEIIVYNLSTLPISFEIKQSMNNIAAQSNYNFANPYLDESNIYIIDGGNINS